MMARRERFFFFALVVVVNACGGSSSRYSEAISAAERARREKNFVEEREQYDAAIAVAERTRDEVEARYRRSHTWIRERKYEQAATDFEALATQYPRSTRAARSWLDAGRAWEKNGNIRRALTAYLRCISSYPHFGGTISAADRWVALRASAPKNESKYWRDLLALNREITFDEALRYRFAQSLELISEVKAVAAYEDLARKYPLPSGAYADEALLRSAQLRRRLGQPASALTALKVLTDQKSHAQFVGSYARPAYTEAWLLRGLILRDDLALVDEAKQAFSGLINSYPDSRLVDDALFELARTEGPKSPGACRAFKELKNRRPVSRFLACKEYFCPKEPSTGGPPAACRFVEPRDGEKSEPGAN